ncbi:gamma tubulin complex Spc97/GCP2 subunit Alp4 [Thecaphora frezii]
MSSRPRLSGVSVTNGATAGVPATPARSIKKRNNLQLSAKQFDKMSRRILAVQKSASKHTRADTPDDLNEEAAGVPRIDSIPELGEGGHRRTSSYIISEGDDAAPDPSEPKVRTTTEYHLRRFGKAPVSRGLSQGAGKGPDGAALAAAAAKSLKGKGVAHPDSFLNEGSFIFNPLNRRLPQPSPRKIRASSGTSRPNATVSDPSSSKRPATLPHTSADPPKPGSSSKAVNKASNEVADIEDRAIPLSLADKEIQEALILEDLLHVMVGVEGQYILYSEAYDPESPASRLKGATYTIGAALDPPLKDLAERILPIATYYTSISAFIEMDNGLEFGTVNHALCSAIRDLLQGYEVLVVQLEHQLATSATFTLQKMWCWVQETLRTLQMVHSLTEEIASITHADLFEQDDDDSSDSDDGSEISGTSQLERERRALLGLDDPQEEGIEGGIAKGGEVLSMLWSRITKTSGDPKAHKLYTALFRRASQPYARTLVKWITTGDLSDTYEEFMVMEDAKVTRASLESDPTDEYWETRYTLRDETMIARRERQKQLGLDMDEDLEEDGEEATTRGFLTGGAKIPTFLEPWKHKILLAGKYLNVMRECGLQVGQSSEGIGFAEEEEEVVIIMNDENFFRRIEAAYQKANSELLRLLMQDQDIVQRLRSVKHFMFYSESDFLMSFLEQAAHELRKTVNPQKIRETTQVRLQTHLGAVLGSSSTVGFHDPYREDIRVELASEGAYEQLKRIADIKGGIESTKALQKAEKLKQKAGKDREAVVATLFQFDVAVKFPVSLVISKKNILRWQFVHRCLTNLKMLERALCDIWIEHKEGHWRTVMRDHPPLEAWKRRVFKLRHRMTFFVQQVLAFQMLEVIEPNWRDLEAKMENAKTVDQFMKDHFEYLNRCRKECMLTDLRYLEYHSRLVNYVSVFHENRVRFRDQLQIECSRWEAEKLAKGAADAQPTVQQATIDFLAKFENAWDRGVRTLRDVVNLLSTTDNPAALPLAYRLQSALL